MARPLFKWEQANLEAEQADFMSMTRLADEARHAQVVVDIGVGFTKRVEGEDEKQLRPWVAVRGGIKRQRRKAKDLTGPEKDYKKSVQDAKKAYRESEKGRKERAQKGAEDGARQDRLASALMPLYDRLDKSDAMLAMKGPIALPREQQVEEWATKLRLLEDVAAMHEEEGQRLAYGHWYMTAEKRENLIYAGGLYSSSLMDSGEEGRYHVKMTLTVPVSLWRTKYPPEKVFEPVVAAYGVLIQRYKRLKATCCSECLPPVMLAGLEAHGSLVPHCNVVCNVCEHVMAGLCGDRFGDWWQWFMEGRVKGWVTPPADVEFEDVPLVSVFRDRQAEMLEGLAAALDWTESEVEEMRRHTVYQAVRTDGGMLGPAPDDIAGQEKLDEQVSYCVTDLFKAQQKSFVKGISVRRWFLLRGGKDVKARLATLGKDVELGTSESGQRRLRAMLRAKNAVFLPGRAKEVEVMPPRPGRRENGLKALIFRREFPLTPRERVWVLDGEDLEVVEDREALFGQARDLVEDGYIRRREYVLALKSKFGASEKSEAWEVRMEARRGIDKDRGYL